MRQYIQRHEEPDYAELPRYLTNLNAQSSKSQKNFIDNQYGIYIQNLNSKPLPFANNQVGLFESKNIKIQGAEKKDNIYIPYENKKYTITRDQIEQAEQNQLMEAQLRELFRVNKPILEIQRFDDIFKT